VSLEQTFERCAALCVGLTALTFGMPQGGIEGATAMAGLAGYILGRKAKYGPESKKVVDRIRLSI
jgi:hypothetical protein